MNENIPVISVIMPIWNGAAYRDAAIQSVLQQGMENIEIILVDDGSTDNTAELAGAYGTTISYLYQSNQGPAVARNTGLQVATGHYVAFIDADDLWVNGRLLRQLHYLQAHPQIDIVQVQIRYMRQINAKWEVYDPPFFALSMSTGLFTRALFGRIGMFDPTLRYSEDVDWLIRAHRMGIVTHRCTEVVLHYRRHQTNLTNNIDLIKYYTLVALSNLKRTRQTNI